MLTRYRKKNSMNLPHVHSMSVHHLILVLLLLVLLGSIVKLVVVHHSILGGQGVVTMLLLVMGMQEGLGGSKVGNWLKEKKENHKIRLLTWKTISVGRKVIND